MECANNERMNPLNMANKQDGSGEAEAEAVPGIQNNVLLSKPRLQFQLAKGGRGRRGTAPCRQRVCPNCHIKMDDLFVLLIYCATASGPPRLVEGNCCHRRWRWSLDVDVETIPAMARQTVPPGQDIEYAQCMSEWHRGTEPMNSHSGANIMNFTRCHRTWHLIIALGR